MAAGFGSYEIARSGLYTSERALIVTGHNISNLNTPGYVRQQAIIADAPYWTVQGKNRIYQYGVGAGLQQIRQVRNRFLDVMYRNESMAFGYWEARLKTVQDLEAILGDPMSEGLQYVMNQFWDSWQELSKDPDSLTVRAIVRQRAENLVNTLNHMGEQLDKLQKDLVAEIRVRIDEVNEITSQVAKLNTEIYKYELAGGTANDLRDQRNVLADRLTRLVNANIEETADGRFYITIGGYTVVNGGKSRELYLEENKGSISPPVVRVSELGAEVSLESGTIKGLMDSIGKAGGTEEDERGSITSVYKAREMLNNLVKAMVERVNDLHRSGKTLKQPPTDGEDFFVPVNSAIPIAPGNIKLNDNLDDLANIVASSSGKSGDNIIALQMANIRHEPLIADETGMLSIDEYYQALILKIGQSGAQALNVAENQGNLLRAVNAKREALSGVSLDEELTNMMKYKFAYDASSRAFNVIDQMIETIINRMGIVGRL